MISEAVFRANFYNGFFVVTNPWSAVNTHWDVCDKTRGMKLIQWENICYVFQIKPTKTVDRWSIIIYASLCISTFYYLLTPTWEK